jgi:hypothetical protein
MDFASIGCNGGMTGRSMASDFHVARRDAANDHSGHPFSTRRHGVAALKRECIVIILGVILVVLGALLSVPILYYIGAILLVVGVVLWILGASGRAVGGRPHYW